MKTQVSLNILIKTEPYTKMPTTKIIERRTRSRLSAKRAYTKHSHTHTHTHTRTHHHYHHHQNKMSTVCAAVTVHSNNIKSLSYSRFSMKNFCRKCLMGQHTHSHTRICIAYIILRNHISNNGNKLSVKYPKWQQESEKWEKRVSGMKKA